MSGRGGDSYGSGGDEYGSGNTGSRLGGSSDYSSGNTGGGMSRREDNTYGSGGDSYGSGRQETGSDSYSRGNDYNDNNSKDSRGGGELFELQTFISPIIGMVEANVVRYHRFYGREAHGQGYWAIQVTKCNVRAWKIGDGLVMMAGDNCNYERVQG